MQERELMKAGILGAASEQDVKQQHQLRPRFIKPHNTMNTDNTNNSSSNISSNPTNNNNSSISNNNNNNSNNSSNANNQPPPLRCPRCDSQNTKFCYYNNYSLLQPRYFCKSCRRYWTKGGALRNVPVGGGCRKNKRITSRQRIAGACTASDLISPSSSSSFLSHPHLGDHHHPPAPPFSPFAEHHPPRPPHSLTLLNHPHDHPSTPNLLYFNLPPSHDSLMKENPLLNQPLLQSPSPAMPAAHHELHPSSNPAAAGLFSRQLASYLPSSLASQYLSNVGSLPLHNLHAGFNHDYLSAGPAAAGPHDHQPFLHPSSFNTSQVNSSMHLGNAPPSAATTTSAGSSHHDQSNMGFKAFSLPFDNLNSTADDHHHHHHHQQQQQHQADQTTGHWATNKTIPHEQKLLTDQKLSHMSNPAMENQADMEGPGRLYTQLRPQLQSPKAEEGWPSAAVGAPPHHEPAGGTAAAGDQAANYWSISGGWNEMPGYNPGADHPFM